MNTKITSSATWWRLYAQNLGHFQFIVRNIYAENSAEFMISDIWKCLERFDPLAATLLNKIWFAAPDHPVIHKLLDWGDLCDLCSEHEALELDPLVPHNELLTSLTAQQKERANELAKLLAGHWEARIAGGAVRDYVMLGERARDIDFYTNLDSFIPGSRVPKLLSEFGAAQSEYQEPAIVSSRVLDSSCAGTTKLQVIKLQGSPVAWINTFDAACNMISLDHNGSVFVHHAHALEDIEAKVYRFNATRRDSDERLELRVQKFLARGWSHHAN